MVKRVHPDSAHPEANAEKFQEVDECFKFLMEKFAKGRRNIELDPDEDVKVFDIQHTAPQHRQYLSHGGYGIGSPYQREKQYQQIRAMQAQDNVLEHRLQKSAASEKDLIKKGGGQFFKRHAIKTKYGFDRVVEDLIQEAMSKGDFTKLSGVGKPLKDNQDNPYVDFTTHKINKILIDNGFTPEWIMLSKDIRKELDELKTTLKEERASLTLNGSDENWQEIIERNREVVDRINKQIDKFNLLVPILNKQMVHLNIEKIAEKIAEEEPINAVRKETRKGQAAITSSTDEGFLSMINSMLK